MRFSAFVLVFLMLGVACSGGASDAVKEPAVDLAATVEAAVEATRSAEREIRTPVPTAMPVSTATLFPTATPEPTATPVPMATHVPTPEPYVASPGSLEAGAARMSRCFRDENFRAFIMQMIVASGDVTLEEADAFVSFLSHEEFWELYLSEGTEDDPAFAQMLSLYGEIPDEVCSSEFHPGGAVAAAPEGSVGVASTGGEMAESAGELFDCLQVNEELARVFWKSAGDVGTPAFVEGLRSDRQLFVDFVVAGAVIGELDLSEVRSQVDRACG